MKVPKVESTHYAECPMHFTSFKSKQNPLKKIADLQAHNCEWLYM